MAAVLDPTKNLGNDSTATFEDDPTFIDANPGAGFSSENVEEQRDTDDIEDSDDDDDVDEDEEFDDEDDEDEDELDEDDELDDDAEDDEDEVGVAALVGASLCAPGEDDDAGDLEPGVDEDEIGEDDMDTDRVVAQARMASQIAAASAARASQIQR